MTESREYAKPTVTKVEVQPDESIIKACKPDLPLCKKALETFGS